MMYSKDYRQVARDKLGNEWTKNKWATFAFMTFLYLIITTVVFDIDIALGSYEMMGIRFTSGIGALFSFLTAGAFSYTFAVVSLKAVRGNAIVENDLWCGFKLFYKTFLLNVLNAIFIFLYCLLLIVPGIIKAISYSMSYYLMADNPEMTANEARLASERLMNGHKLDLFCLWFSFVGWFILCTLTCGILLIWIKPYKETAFAVFYQDIMGERVKNGN